MSHHAYRTNVPAVVTPQLPIGTLDVGFTVVTESRLSVALKPGPRIYFDNICKDRTDDQHRKRKEEVAAD